MGRKSLTGGAIAVGTSRIRFDFTFEGVRYRPSLAIVPIGVNLRRARLRLKEIKQRIAQGTFSFVEEFPHYRFLKRTPEQGSPRTCNHVFDAFLAHCEVQSESRHGGRGADFLPSHHRQRLAPRIGAARFLDVRHSALVALADGPSWSKKMYNSAITVLRRAFELGHRDYPERRQAMIIAPCSAAERCTS